MNLLFRLLRILFGAPFRARVGLLDETGLRMRVWPTDLDGNLHLTNSRYLSMMDLGRMNLMARSGALGPMLRWRWRPLVGSVVLRFRRSLPAFRRFSLKTRLLCWDDKWLYLEQRFESDGDVIAIGLAKGLFRGPGGNVAPGELLTALGYADTVSPDPDEPIRAWTRMEDDLSHRLRGARRAA
ncbi:MAG: thioesterase family protein [Chromatiales bacterium]